MATWKIENDYLYLVKVVEGTCSAKAKEIPISLIFPGQQGPIKATWFTGTIRIPQGEQLQYVHMGYGSIYEKELILRLENGKLIDESIIDNTKGYPTEEEKTLEELQKLKDWEDKQKVKD